MDSSSGPKGYSILAIAPLKRSAIVTLPKYSRVISSNFCHMGNVLQVSCLSHSAVSQARQATGASEPSVAALNRGYALSRAVNVGAQLAAMTLQVAGSCCPEAAGLLEEA